MTLFHKTVESFQAGARTLPGRYYTSPEVFEDERERLARTQWFCVGRVAQLEEPGSYFLREICGESIIVLRDRRGTIRAFYNVCRHRGTRICEQEEGRLSETMQCPYHAWTYATDGRLVGAPHMNETPGFDRADYPLHPAAIDSWEGFLFVNLAEAPEPLAVRFAPLLGRFRRFNLPLLRMAHRLEYEVHANWKLVFQNYSECLHCPTIHPELSARLPYTSGANDLTEGPFLGGYMLITAPHQSATMTGRACAIPLGDLPADELRRAYYYTIFPNLLLSLHPDYAVGYTLWPQAPDRTRIVCEWLFHPEAAGRPGFNPGDAIEFWDRTNRQDWHISEQSQRGVASRVYRPGPYSARESMPAAWDRAYLEEMKRGTRPGGVSPPG